MARVSLDQIADAEISEGKYTITVIVNARFYIFVSVGFTGGWIDYKFTDLNKAFGYLEASVDISPEAIKELRAKLSSSVREAAKTRIPEEISYLTKQFNQQLSYYNNLVSWAGLNTAKDKLEEFDEGTRDAQ